MFHRIPVPTPFEVGRVNAYVAGRTIFDPGPNSEKAWETLVDGLAALDLTPSDVEQVVITHPHLDHFGLGKRFADLGATMVASPEAADIMTDFRAHLEYEQSYFAPFFERCGVDSDISNTVVTLPEPFVSYASNFETDVELSAGETFTVGETTITVDTLSGHANGELCFGFEHEGDQWAIVGDHVLASITPNPFLLAPSKEGGERPHQVAEFNRSLERLASRDFDRFLPGHGEPIDDPAGRIQEILDAHERRTAEVRALVDGPTQPVDVMESLFEDLPVTEYFLGMSEAVGHLDLLVERGEVVREEDAADLFYLPAE